MKFDTFKKRSIATQYSAEYSFSASVNNTTGECSFGLSGDNDVLSFSLKEGKIIDYNNRFVGSYQAGETVLFSGYRGYETNEYYINNKLVALENGSWNNGWKNLFVDPRGLVVDFDCRVDGGNVPVYSLINSGSCLNSGDSVAGAIINESENQFRILDVIVDSGSYPFYVSSFTTGDIETSGNFYLTSTSDIDSLIVPITLVTNFGAVNFDFNVSGVIPNQNGIYLRVSPNSVKISNGHELPYLVSYSNTGLNDVYVSLERISGTTGIINAIESIESGYSTLISGFVSGAQRITQTVVSSVSAVDPITSGVISGLGTGILTSDIIYPTGEVSQIFTETLYGVGSGFIPQNFLATGDGIVYAEGRVGLTGKVFQVEAANVAGTGENPIFATGIIPTGRGTYVLNQETPFVLSSTLGTGDVYQGVVVGPKVFEGMLSVDYSIPAVGYAVATGDDYYSEFVVDSLFAAKFEPGYYTFTKSNAGLCSGNFALTSSFDPVRCKSELSPVFGNLTGSASFPLNPQGGLGHYGVASGEMLTCLVDGLPMLSFSEKVSYLILPSDSYIYPYKIVQVAPTGDEPFESSANFLTGVATRTQTSRMGETPSGNGYFHAIINKTCEDSSGEWRESFDSIKSGQSIYDPKDCYLQGLSSQIENGDGVSDVSGRLDFTISGSGTKLIALRGIADDGYPTQISLYTKVTSATPSTGSLTWNNPASGEKIGINGTIHYYDPSKSYYPYFYDILSLTNHISMNRSKVSAFLSGSSTKIYLQSTTSGSYSSNIPLSGSSGFVFNASTLVGGLDSFTRDVVVAENSKWLNNYYNNYSILQNSNLEPTHDSDAALVVELKTGNYWATIKTIRDVDNLIGKVSFDSTSFTGYEYNGYAPIQLVRQGGSKGEISGVISFSSQGAIPQATPYSDYDADPIEFYFYDGQTGIQLFVPIVNDGNVETDEKFFATIDARNQYGLTSIGSISNAAIYIASSGTIPTPQVNSGTVPYPMCSGCAIGDTHLIFKHPDLDYAHSPFNVEDNISAGKVLYFYAKTASGEYKVEYTQAPFEKIPGGYFVNGVTIKSPHGTKELIGVPHSNPNFVSGISTEEANSYLDGLLTLRAECGWEDGEIFLNCVPTSEWYNTSRIGGIFYYLYKQCANLGSGAHNNPSAVNYDGITNFLSPIGKTRGTFELPCESDNQTFLSNASEKTSFSTVKKIFDKWNEYCNETVVRGISNHSWDVLMPPPTGIPDAPSTGSVVYTWNESFGSTNTPICSRRTMGSTYFQNPFSTPALMSVQNGHNELNGQNGVDDLLAINSNLVGAGEICYGQQAGCFCGFAGVEMTVGPYESLLFEVIDNYYGGSHVAITITFTAI